MKKTKLLLLMILVVFSLAACTSSADKATQQGKEALENHEYDEALSYFEQAIREGSTDFQVEDSIVLIEAYNKALSLFEKGDLEEAREELGKIKFSYSDYAISSDIDKLKESITDKIENPDLDGEEDAAEEPEEVPEVYDVVEEDVIEREEPSISSKKREYLDKIAETERKANAVYASDDKVAAQMASETYVLWDDLLNEIWGVLKKDLPEHEMDQLLTEQRQWIKNKEAQSSQIASDGLGTSAIASNEHMLTEKRCKELVEWYM